MDRILRLPEAALRFGSADLALRFAAAENVRRSANNIILTSIPAVFLCVCNGALLFYYAPAAAAVALCVFILLVGCRRSSRGCSVTPCAGANSSIPTSSTSFSSSSRR
jgi:ABC-type bacteriocin/lantibiotic exporter with double-glycine peptidase domain